MELSECERLDAKCPRAAAFSKIPVPPSLPWLFPCWRNNAAPALCISDIPTRQIATQLCLFLLAYNGPS